MLMFLLPDMSNSFHNQVEGIRCFVLEMVLNMSVYESFA